MPLKASVGFNLFFLEGSFFTLKASVGFVSFFLGRLGSPLT